LADAALATAAAGVSAPPLRVVRVSKTYEDGDRLIPVIGELSLTLGRGEIVSLVGPSGCGKSTLLNVVSGLLPPTSGDVFWHGEPLRGSPARVGYMLQKDLLFSWRTALENAMLGLELRGETGGEARDRAEILLDRLGLHGFAKAYPATLSGGMRQRVALARTLAPDPDVLLLDEPFAALDFQTKLLIQNDTVRLVRERERAALLITHDIEEAVAMSDRVIVLSQRPTRVVRTYEIEGGDGASDMMAARQRPGFTDMVHDIWAHLQGGRR
jgi:NitT/TauT family transport system ATP-binding protein